MLEKQSARSIDVNIHNIVVMINFIPRNSKLLCISKGVKAI